MDIYTKRGEEEMKNFIFNHIKENSNIITDVWRSYNFLDEEDVNYTHAIHLLGPNRNFGLGLHSTSHI